MTEKITLIRLALSAKDGKTHVPSKVSEPFEVSKSDFDTNYAPGKHSRTMIDAGGKVKSVSAYGFGTPCIIKKE
jgi:hypothetical protein